MTEEEKKAKQAEEGAAEKTGINNTMTSASDTPAEPVAEGGESAEKPGETVPVAEPPAEPAAPSQRERYMNSYREDYPDMDADDEEAFYSQANKNYAELKNARETSKNLDNALQQFPGLNDMVVLASRGENPFVWLAENLGLDIRDIAEDPEFAQKLGEGLAKYHQKEAEKEASETKNKKDAEAYGEEMKQNFTQSAQNLASLQKDMNLSDDDCTSIFTDFFNNVVENGKKGIVDTDTWKAIINARNYEGDMETARKEAATKALNEKFQNRVQGAQTPSEIPPSAPGAGGRGSGKQKGFWEGID